MLLRCLLTALAALAAACGQPGAEIAGTRSAPLIGGALEEGDPGAVALLADIDESRPGPEVFCSGTLVSPRVVVTAAHCIDEAGADPDLTVYFGADAYGEGTRIGAVRAAAHPGWTGELEGNHDIGLILLAFAADPAWATPLYLEPLSEEEDSGRPVRRIGFGLHQADLPEPDGRKRSGETTISYVSSSMDWFFAGDEELVPCSGDSGGPVLIGDPSGGPERLVGVHSFGRGCESTSAGATRVDLYAADFILPWIAENDPSCGADNLCAPVGCEGDPDCLPCGPEGTCASDCERPDLDCRTQDIGEICQADTQCTTDLCVYWQDEPNTHFCTRPCQGDGDCPGGMSCRAVEPFGRVCYPDEPPPGTLGSACTAHAECGSYTCEDGTCVIPCDLSAGQGCPDGFECAARGDGSTYYCWAEDAPGGSCGVAAPAGAPAIAAFLCALALARARRRR